MPRIDRPFRSTLNKANLFAADKAVVAGEFVQLGKYTIPAGVAIAPGYGAMEGQDTAAGRILIAMMNNAAAPGVAIEGLLRLSVRNPQDRPVMILWESRTERVRLGATDPKIQVPFPWMNAIATEDFSLVLEFRADAAGTAGSANSTCLVDVTTYDAVQ